MSTSMTWLTIVIAGTGCYLLRISLVALLRGRQPSASAIRTAGYVMPAAFAALAAAALLHTADNGAADATVPVAGAAVTATVAVRTKNANAALIAGLAAAGVATVVGAALSISI